MRSFQLIRYGRRTTPINHELTQSIKNSFNSTSLSKRRASISVFPNEQYRDVQQSDGNDKSFRHR
jgi:hypothetical protein